MPVLDRAGLQTRIVLGRRAIRGYSAIRIGMKAILPGFILCTLIVMGSAYGEDLVLQAETLPIHLTRYLLIESERLEGKYLEMEENTPGVSWYSGGTLPDTLDAVPKMYTLKTRFRVDEVLKGRSLALYSGISEYPFRIYLNGLELAVRGRYEALQYNSSMRAAELIYLSRDLLKYGDGVNELVLELYPKFEVWALDDLHIDFSELVAGEVFWRNFFGINVVQATVILSFALFFYFSALFLLDGARKLTHLYFALICISFCMSYFNILIYHVAIDEAPLEAISKAGLVLSSTFLLLFCCEFTDLFSRLKPRTRRYLLFMPFGIGVTASLCVLCQTSKQGVLSVFGVLMNFFIAPQLFLDIFILGYTFLKKKNRQIIPLFISFIIILACALHDMFYMNSMILPYVWLTTYGYFTYIIAIFSMLVVEQSGHYRDSLRKTQELLVSNTEIEGLVTNLSREKAERENFIVKLEASAVENNLLMHELEHRVYNNLQIIQSMLGLQKQRIIGNAKEELAKAYSRVSVISLMYDYLVDSDKTPRVRLDQYFERVAHLAMQANKPDMDISLLRFEMRPVYTNSDDATLIAMVFNELISNAITHGSLSVRRIILDEVGGNIVLSVENGLEKTMEPRSEDRTLGLTLADIVSIQLDGTLTKMESDTSVRFELVCPLLIKNERNLTR